jgi:hypothetical protein
VTRKKLKLTKANWEEWKRLLLDGSTREQIGPLMPSQRLRTSQIESSMHLTVAIPKTLGNICFPRSTPWWDSECSKIVVLRRKAKGKLFHSPTTENLAEYRRREAIAKHTTLKKKTKLFRVCCFY